MKWYLVLQVLASWPVASQPPQFQGPFETKDQCEQVFDQLKSFNVEMKCIGVPQVQAK